MILLLSPLQGDKGNGKQDREPGELSEDSDDEAWPQEPEKLEMPPGKWRVGLPYSKAKCLFLRFATKGEEQQSSRTIRVTIFLQLSTLLGNRQGPSCLFCGQTVS